MYRGKTVLISVAVILALIYILLTHLPHFLNDPRPNSGAWNNQVSMSNLTWPQPTIWVSMAVCLSSNTRFHGKDRFPYLLALKLSSQLWLTKVPKLKTIIQVVHEPSDRGAPELENYVKYLKTMGNHIVETVETFDDNSSNVNSKKLKMPCSLKAQLQRMFVPNSAKRIVKPNDIIVTTDVDTFVMKSEIFDDLLSINNLGKIGILQYDYTNMDFVADTFPMSFISMPNRLWRSLLIVESPDDLVEAHSNALGIGDYSKYTWYYDQMILSRIILKSGLCTVSKLNKMWKKTKLTPPENNLNDSKTCFHGVYKWSECSMLKRPPNHPLGVCMYYHFFPSQSPSDLRRVHNGIMKDRFKDIWTWKEVAISYFVNLMWPLAPNMYSS